LPLPNLSAADAFPRLPYPLWLPGGCTVFCYRTLMQSGERAGLLTRSAGTAVVCVPQGFLLSKKM